MSDIKFMSLGRSTTKPTGDHGPHLIALDELEIIMTPAVKRHFKVLRFKPYPWQQMLIDMYFTPPAVPRLEIIPRRRVRLQRWIAGEARYRREQVALWIAPWLDDDE